MANSEGEQFFIKNGLGEFEEVPPVKCTLMHNTKEGINTCNGIIFRVDIHKPSDEHTRIGGSYISPLIDSFGFCQKCHVRYGSEVFMIMENGSPVQLYRHISHDEEKNLRRRIESVMRTATEVSGMSETKRNSVDELMKEYLYKPV